MQKKRLGNSDLELTAIGVGAWAIGGGGWAFGWGPQDDNESIEAIQTALDGGVNWIDTAAVYGLGHSEEVVARALEGRSNRPYVFTKCERTWNENREIKPSLKAESIRKECEASLRRLKVDTIDLYQIHWPQPEEDVEEGWGELARLKEAGKVRWIGVSNFNAQQLERIAKIAPVTSLQPLGDFAGDRKRDSAVLPAEQYRSHRLFADEIGTVDRQDDARTGRVFSSGRFPAQGAGLPGAEPDAQSDIGGFDA
jgi:aryl-alcohol dehydrogenase-like predicted oxidoreductase